MEFPPAIPRVEATHSHRLFVEAVEPKWVMVNLVHARQIVKRGETANSYFPDDVRVIVTSTIPDTNLYLMPWERELEIVREFNPDAHIPTDSPVYEEQDPEERMERVEECIRGAFWMSNRLDIPVIPLIKGLTTNERERCYRLSEELGQRWAAFYAAQYFNSGGNYICQLEDDLKRILDERDLNLLVIGLLSPNYAGRLPDGVQSLAGQTQWRERVSPTIDTPQSMRKEWQSLADEIAMTLG